MANSHLEVSEKPSSSKSFMDRFRRSSTMSKDQPQPVMQNEAAMATEKTLVGHIDTNEFADFDEKKGFSPKLKSVATDDTFTPAPVEGFHPQRIFHFVKHSGLSSDIRINEITSIVDMSAYEHTDEWNTPIYNAAVKAAETDTPYIVVHRHKWYGLSQTAYWARKDSGDPIKSTDNSKGKNKVQELQGEPLLDWRCGWSSSNENTLTFKEDASDVCGHPITMKCDNYWKFRDAFVLDSAKYTWRSLSTFVERSFALESTIGGQKTLIAQLWGPKWSLSQTGILVVDETKIDPAVAVMTALVMLRKQRQRAAEHSA